MSAGLSEEDTIPACELEIVEENKFDMLEANPVEVIGDEVEPVWEVGIAKYVGLDLLETVLDEPNETDTLLACEPKVKLEMVETSPVELRIDETDALPNWDSDEDSALKLEEISVDPKDEVCDVLVDSEFDNAGEK
jgi:hypothetical protein